MLFTRGVILLANLLNGLRMQVEAFLSGAAGQLVKVVIVEPFPAGFNGFGLHLVTEIPNKIYRSSLRKKPHGVLNPLPGIGR